MKNILAAALASLITASSFGESIESIWEAHRNHALTITTNLSSGLIVWTNHVETPISPSYFYAQVADGTTNAVTLKYVRLFDLIYEKLDTEVVTNEFGEIQTNTYNQVTNITALAVTNVLYSGTLTGTVRLSEGALLPSGAYTRRGDVWTISVGTGNVPIILDFKR